MTCFFYSLFLFSVALIHWSTMLRVWLSICTAHITTWFSSLEHYIISFPVFLQCRPLYTATANSRHEIHHQYKPFDLTVAAGDDCCGLWHITNCLQFYCTNAPKPSKQTSIVCKWMCETISSFHLFFNE